MALNTILYCLPRREGLTANLGYSLFMPSYSTVIACRLSVIDYEYNIIFKSHKKLSQREGVTELGDRVNNSCHVFFI